MDQPQRETKTVVELLMEVVAPIVGSITFAFFLKSWSPLPTWACLLIAVPVGTILGWGLMLAVFWSIASILGSQQRDCGEPSDEPKSRSRRF